MFSTLTLPGIIQQVDTFEQDQTQKYLLILYCSLSGLSQNVCMGSGELEALVHSERHVDQTLSNHKKPQTIQEYVMNVLHWHS